MGDYKCKERSHVWGTLSVKRYRVGDYKCKERSPVWGGLQALKGNLGVRVTDLNKNSSVWL